VTSPVGVCELYSPMDDGYMAERARPIGCALNPADEHVTPSTSSRWAAWGDLARTVAKGLNYCLGNRYLVRIDVTVTFGGRDNHFAPTTCRSGMLFPPRR